MRAEHFLYFNNSRIQGEDLVPVKCITPPPPWHRLLSFLRRWFCCCWCCLFIVTPIVGVCKCSMFCCALLYVHCSFAIILVGKRGLVALIRLSSWCLVVAVWLFLAVPWVCLRLVVVVFSDHTYYSFFIKKEPEKDLS